MFIFTFALGVAAVAAIALSPLYAGRLRPFGSMRLGAACISLAVGIATVCLATSGTSAMRRTELFLCSFVLMLVGAVLVLRKGDDPDEHEPGERPDDEPPWWPDFEEGFRSYAVRRRRPLVPTR
jgi:hypothetical protein